MEESKLTSKVPDVFSDLASIRISDDYASSASVKEIFRIPVHKPNKQVFFRAHKTLVIDTKILERKEENETYVVVPALWEELDTELSTKRLILCISRQTDLFVWPIGLGGGNLWGQSALEASEVAMKGWIRLVANRGAGMYEIYRPAKPLAEPHWPEMTIQEMLSKAFRGYVIDTLEHPVVKELRGDTI
jgi:hypothetical protein